MRESCLVSWSFCKGMITLRFSSRYPHEIHYIYVLYFHVDLIYFLFLYIGCLGVDEYCFWYE